VCVGGLSRRCRCRSRSFAAGVSATGAPARSLIRQETPLRLGGLIFLTRCDRRPAVSPSAADACWRFADMAWMRARFNPWKFKCRRLPAADRCPGGIESPERRLGLGIGLIAQQLRYLRTDLRGNLLEFATTSVAARLWICS